jgi:FixJ family two-component response regulator
VFVVDDDDSVHRALARLIHSAGYRVEAFGNARAFLERLREVTSPACLVLDVQLPDLDGLVLQRELKALLPIIFITGGDIPMTVDAMKVGATDFLAKLVTTSICSARSNRHSNGWRKSARCAVSWIRSVCGWTGSRRASGK